MSGDEKRDREPKPAPTRIPALFATIHFQSDQRPNGYTDEQIAQLNELANRNDDTGDDGS